MRSEPEATVAGARPRGAPDDAEPRPLPPAPPCRSRSSAEQQPEQVAEETGRETAKPKEGPGKGSGEGPGEGPGKGILAFREKLAGFTENQQLARLGAQARITDAGACRACRCSAR